MKLGLHIAETSWRGGAPALRSNLKDIVQTAEGAGFDAIDVADHVWQSHYLGGDLESEVEAYTTLGFIAAHTERVRLLALATAASYRPPGLLAKMVTTLDVLSGGRMMLGIGAGDYEEEAVGLGLPYPSLRERFEILEDTVQVCLRMWDGERGDEQPFEGRHVRLGRALNVPQSLSRPHPPILIAGGGREADPAARRPLRRRVQHPAVAGHPAQARPPAPPVRRGRPRLRRDREDGAVRLRRRRGRLEGGRGRQPARRGCRASGSRP